MMHFKYHYPESTHINELLVEVAISEDSSLDEVAEAFKGFLLAAGYQLNDVVITYGNNESV